MNCAEKIREPYYRQEETAWSLSQKQNKSISASRGAKLVPKEITTVCLDSLETNVINILFKR